LNNSGVQVGRHGWIALFSAAFLAFASRKYGFFQMDNRIYITPWLFLSASFAGIYMNSYLGKVIENTSFLRGTVAYIGRRSLIIMALHLSAFKIITAIYIKANNVPYYWLAKFPVISGNGGWWIAYTAAGVGVPLVLSAVSGTIREWVVEQFVKGRELDISTQ
jgi:fucose 4-O-acetylase-like acetyltransferase